jgi:hypothetical protein
MRDEDSLRSGPSSGETSRRASATTRYAEMSSGDLLAIFMKLSIQQPQNDPEQMKALAELGNEVRKRGLEEELRRRQSGRAHKPPDE